MRSRPHISAVLFAIVISTFMSTRCAMSDPPQATETNAPVSAPPAGSASPVTVSGVITDEGAECLAMRADDNTLYTIGRPKEKLTAGDRVRVTGTVAEMSICMQGVTLNVTRLERLPERP